ncbi:UNVERIFIED_CONTAM: hypothetical protein FKN15_036541 [Acipenser sinensis]
MGASRADVNKAPVLPDASDSGASHSEHQTRNTSQPYHLICGLLITDLINYI